MSAPAIPIRPFYVTGGTLKPGEPSYVERKADTELLESLLAGEFCYILTPRQMGKSSLMARSAARLEQAGIRSAIVDLTQIGSEKATQAAGQWYFGIANEIHRRLGIVVPLRPWWQERSDLSPVQRLVDFFRELVLTNVPGRVVVFVDEIDSTISLPFADDFFAALRACFNARATEPAFERLTFVLLGVATPDQLIQDPTRTPFNIGRRIVLTDFSLDEAQKLGPELHSDPDQANQRLERVLYWTAGHPYLTQVLCRAVREMERAAENETVEKAVDPLVNELFLTSRAQREETNLKHARARLERPGPEGRRLLQLYLRVCRGKPVADQPTSPLFAQLKLAGVVKTTEEGRLVVRNHVYEAVFTPEWVVSVMPVERGRYLAAAVLAASVAFVLIWYAFFQPRPYVRYFQAAIVDDTYNRALEAYSDLRTNPFSRPQAAELMQQFWQQRALRHALAGERDESLLSSLMGLSLKHTERLRRQAQNLVGWDYENLRLTLRHEGGVVALAFSPDGRTLVTGSEDTVQLWDVRTGTHLRPPLQHEDAVVAVVFSPNRQTFATGSGHTVRLWNARSGVDLTPPLQHQDAVVTLAFSPDGRILATGSRDHTARLWSTLTGRPLTLPLQHEDAVVALAFSPDGRTLVTGSWDRTARLWDTRTGESIGPALQHKNWVTAVAFDPNNRVLATGSADYTARLWNARSGKPLGLPLQHENYVLALAFSPDGQTLATGSADRASRLWAVDSGKILAPPLQHEDYVIAVAFSPSGRILATGSWDRTARLWDTRMGEPLTPPLQHQGFVNAMTFSVDGGILATGSDDGTVRLWSSNTGKPFKSTLLSNDFIIALDLRGDGRILATGSTRGSTELWDTRTRKYRAFPSQHGDTILSVSFSPDGRILATGSKDHTARLWDVHTGSLLGPPLRHKDAVVAVSFSPDNRILATGSDDHTVRLWDAASGKPFAPTLQHKDKVIALGFSPDGRMLATGSKDRTSRLWDVYTGEPLSPPLQHEDSVMAVSFSSDGKALATGSRDSSARLWDVRTGEPLTLPLQLQESVRTIAFNRNGNDFFIATDHWLNTFSWDGKKTLHESSFFLHGFWKQSFRFPSDCSDCIQVVLGDGGNSYFHEIIHLKKLSDSPIGGAPRELLMRWQGRLGLTFDQQGNPVPR